MKEFTQAKRHIEVSVGESVRILREFQESSQNELAGISGIPQSAISAIENDRVSLGVERAKTLARALKCHPAVLLFPSWDVEVESAARSPWSTLINQLVPPRLLSICGLSAVLSSRMYWPRFLPVIPTI